MLTLMKGDKGVEAIKELSYLALLFKRWKGNRSHAKFVIIEIKANATFLQLENQLLKIWRFEPMPQKTVINIIRCFENLIK